MSKGLPMKSVNLQEAYIVMVTSDFQHMCTRCVLVLSYHPDLGWGLSPFLLLPQKPSSENKDLCRRFSRQFVYITIARPFAIEHELSLILYIFIYSPTASHSPQPGILFTAHCTPTGPIPHTVLRDAFPTLLSLCLLFSSSPPNSCSASNQQLVFPGLS